MHFYFLFLPFYKNILLRLLFEKEHVCFPFLPFLKKSTEKTARISDGFLEDLWRFTVGYFDCSFLFGFS